MKALRWNPALPGYFTSFASESAPLLPGQSYFVRWAEIQTRDIEDLGAYLRHVGDPWQAIFPVEAKQDAVARITNVSPRVKVQCQ